MSYSLATLWHERQRYLPGILAVAFSALLIALQCGLLWGLLAITSIPVDNTRADIWVGSADVNSVDLGRMIPTSYISRLADCPEVESGSIEAFIQGFSVWKKPDGGTELCMIVGSRLEDNAIGAVQVLSPELRLKLTEPDSIVIDKVELGRLNLKTGLGEKAEIQGRTVHVVGLIEGYKSLAGPYVFCSLSTARNLVRPALTPEQTTYLLGKCHNPADAPAVVARLRERYQDQKDMSAYTAEEFSVRSRMHWLFKTRAGVAVGYTALLGLLVGAVVTSQTLYAATAASMREFAILRALGIPRWRMAVAVMTQSFWVGVIGVGVAIPGIFGLGWLADIAGAKVLLPSWLLEGVLAVTLVMAILSGLFALRSLRHVEPANLLR